MSQPDKYRARVAVVQPVLIPGGGTEAVTAWTIEALKEQYDVSLVTFSPVDAEMLNRYYETGLSDDQFSMRQVKLPLPLRHTRRFTYLKEHLMMRYCKSLHRDFDLFIAIGGAMDFGRKAIQYIALAPASTLVKVLTREPEMAGWYYLGKKWFMRFCESVSGFSEDAMKQNITLATSDWTGKQMKRMYAIDDYRVVYPPTGSPESTISWGMKEQGFVCVARIVPEKSVDQAIDILKLVRQKGFDVSLHIIGRPDDPSYVKTIEEQCKQNPTWIFMHGMLSKQKLFSVIGKYKYGINPAAGEPAGIAAMEIVNAGCILFLRAGAGLEEIVGISELAYENIEEAAEKIISVIRSEELQQSLLEQLSGRVRGFSNQAYCDAIQNVVEDYFSLRRA